MEQKKDLPLGSPPRRAFFRRGIRNALRGYRTIFALVILVVGGWAALDLFRWHELDSSARWLTFFLFFAVVVAIVVLRLVEKPMQRELRLARRGIFVMGEIVSVTPPKRGRALARLTYRYQATGMAEPIEATCRVPRRVPLESLAIGTAIEVLHDPRKPNISKPRLAMDFVEFGAPP